MSPPMTTLCPTKMTTTPATMTAFRVRVVWDTQEEVPEFVFISDDVAESISAEINDLVGGEEDEREEWTNHCVVKHLEATTGWLVSSWEKVEETTPLTIARTIVDEWKMNPVGDEEEKETMDQIAEVLQEGGVRELFECIYENGTGERLPIGMTEAECKDILTLVVEMWTEEKGEEREKCSGCCVSFPKSMLTQHPSGDLDGSTDPYCKACENADE